MSDDLWTCPDCAFTFSADHENTDGSGYSCPVCENAQLELGREADRRRITALEAAARDFLTACDAAQADDGETFACRKNVFDQCGEYVACIACAEADILRSVLAAEHTQPEGP